MDDNILNLLAMSFFLKSILVVAAGLLSPTAAILNAAQPLERRTVQRDAMSPTAENALTVGNLALSGIDYATYQRERVALFAAAEPGDFAALFTHLRRDARPPLMQPGQWHACVNDLFSRLTHRPPPGLDLERELITVVHKAEDVVVRDYALQHLAILAAAEKGPQPEASLALLREAATWKASELSGTALINLYHLGDGVDDGALADRALAVATDPAAREAARSTALQIGVLLKDERFLAPAVEIARRSPIVAHRASAARAIAVFGGPEERTLLLQLRRRGPEPITNIANEALARIENDL